jgi:hypothetical protein
LIITQRLNRKEEISRVRLPVRKEVKFLLDPINKVNQGNKNRFLIIRVFGILKRKNHVTYFRISPKQ